MAGKIIVKDAPTLAAVHSDAPLPNISTAYVRPKRKKKVRARGEASVALVKADAMRQIIYGVALEPNTRDSQGDVVRPEEIEKAAHGYLAKAVRGKATVHRIQHGAPGFFKDKPGIVPIESFIAPADFQYEPAGEVIRKGSWVLVAKVEDPALWQSILDGRFTGWSVGGSGLRTPVAEVAKESGRFGAAFAALGEALDNVNRERTEKQAAEAPVVNIVNHVHVPEQAAPVVHVAAAETPAQHIHVAPSPAPVVNIAPAEAPAIHNHVTVEAARKPVALKAVAKDDGSREYTPIFDDAA